MKAVTRIEKAFTPGDWRPAMKTWNQVWQDLEDVAYWNMLRYLFNIYCHIPDLQEKFSIALGLRETKENFRNGFMRPDEVKAYDQVLKMPQIDVICWFPKEEYQGRIVWFLSHTEYIRRVKDLPGVVIVQTIDTAIIDAFVALNGLEAVVITSEEFIAHIKTVWIQETSKSILL